MKKRLKKFVLKRALRKYLPRRCPSLIPRSGKDAKGVNCWLAEVMRDEQPYFKPRALREESVVGFMRPIEEDAEAVELELDSLLDDQFVFFHYWGETTITFGSVWSVLRNRISGQIYIRILISRCWNFLARVLFNFRSLPEESRKSVIETAINLDLSKENRAFSALEVLNELYSERVFLHPDYQRMGRMVTRKLQSLVDDGCLEEIDHKFVVRGRAYTVLEDLRRDEVRHSDAARRNLYMVLLTVVIAAAASAQVWILMQ